MLKLRVRRGHAVDLPTLDEGEWGMTTDTHEVYMGMSDGNMKLGSYSDVAAVSAAIAPAIAAHKIEAAAHSVSVITDAESTTGAQAKADAAQAAAIASATATAAADATAKVDAHASASPAHDVAQITGAASTAWVTANYYDKTTSDALFMPAGMSPMVAAMIFGG